MDLAMPDVCLTPAVPAPVPVPYPNKADGAMAVNAAYDVLFECTPAHNLGTIVPLTTGDSGGIIGGVASGTDMGSARHLTGANTVLIKGKPATRLSSLTNQNTTNATGVRSSPSQTKVLLLAP